MAIGNYNTTYTPVSTTQVNTADRAFVVGIGTASYYRTDGMTLYKDGTLALYNLSAAPATTTRRMYTQQDSLWFSGTNLMRSTSTPSQLEKLTQNGKTGYRILGVNTANYGTIGTDAVDLSLTDGYSSLTGAMGINAFAAGLNTTASGTGSTAMGGGTASGYRAASLGSFTTASGDYSASMGKGTTALSAGEVAMGNYNTTYTPGSTTTFNSADRALVVGIGLSGTPNDGLIVYKDGTIELDSIGTAPTTTNNRMYTRQDSLWFQNNNLSRGAQLEKITEGGNTGYRLAGVDAANYGNIGSGSVDLTSNLSASGTVGATGNYSFAAGFGTTASGSTSTALGYSTTASGQYSTAMGGANTASGTSSSTMGVNNVSSGSASTTLGNANTASGSQATAIGHGNTAPSYGETVVGSYNSSYTPASTTGRNTADRAFVVGTGISGTPNDGLIVYKDGTVELDSIGTAPTTTNNRMYTRQDSLWFQSTNLMRASPSATMGSGLTARSNGEVAVGSYNTAYTPVSTTAYNSADRSFVVGIGTGIAGATNDGLIVYKDGTIELDSLGASPTTTNNRMYAQGDSLWFQSTNVMRTSPSQLEKLTESSNTGYRLYGATAANYGNIGSGAVDFSSSSSASSTLGATGTNAFATGVNNTASGTSATAMGNGTTATGLTATALGNGTVASGNVSTTMGDLNTASGYASTAMGVSNFAPSYGEVTAGIYTTTYTPASGTAFNAADRAFTVGTGTGTGARNDGLIVYKDGTVELDSLGTAPTTTNNRMYAQSDSLWFQGNNLMRANTSQLEKLTESSNTGYRLYGATAANYGNIGSGAVDFSSSTSVSSTKGATGANAFASGLDNTASGSTSTAMGISTIASGLDATAMGSTTTASGTVSTAMGNNTTASGTNATAMGYNTTALSYGEVAVGNYNTSYTPSGISVFNTADRAFVVGIGTSGGTKDGLTVYKTGTTLVSNNGASIIGTGNILAGTTYNNTALQVSSSASAMTLLSPVGSNTLNVYKSAATTSGNGFASFGYVAGGANIEIGSIKATGTTGVTFSTTSDIRLKTNNGAYRLGLKTINDINIHNYTWKSNGAKEVGVFAQELYKVYPNAVSKGDDDSAVISQRWMVDYSKLVPVLTAAVQDLSAENDRLKAELAAAKDAQSRTEASIDKLNARLDALENVAPVAPTALRK